MKKLFTSIRKCDFETVTAILDKSPELISCMANKIMNLIPNGVIIQGLNAPTDFMTKVKYSGVNSYYHNPLSQIKLTKETLVT